MMRSVMCAAAVIAAASAAVADGDAERGAKRFEEEVGRPGILPAFQEGGGPAAFCD